MSADRYGKGSPLYKALIILLAAALVTAIVYPKAVWDEEAKNRNLCRERMINLHNAELQYRSFFGRFSPQPAALAAFVKTDPRYQRRVDSLVVRPLYAAKKNLDSFRQIQAVADTLIEELIFAGADSAIIDSVDRLENQVIGGSRLVRQALEAVQERMVALPLMPVSTLDKGLEIIQRKDHFLKLEVVKRMSATAGNLQSARSSAQAVLADFDRLALGLQETLAAIAAASAGTDAWNFCPTFDDSLKIALIDSGALQFANIYCPIDSVDRQRSQTDFFKSRIGALKIVNHGRIESNERSWDFKQ
jgi:hypothetical protein